MDRINRRLARLKIVDLIGSVLVVMVLSKYMLLTNADIFRLIVSCFLFAQLMKLILNSKYREITYVSIIMTISIIILNLKIIFLGEFGFSITYLIAHSITQLLILYSIYISDNKFFEEKKYKILSLIVLTFMFYTLSYKFERNIFDMLNILYYYIYFCTWVFILLVNRKKHKYYTDLQKKIQIISLLIIALIFIATMIFNEIGLFFEGNKLLAWDSIILILINEMIINANTREHNVLILIRIMCSYLLIYALLKKGWNKNYYISVPLILIIICQTITKIKMHNNSEKIDNIISYEEEAKKFSDFLHDEILQDVLNIKRETENEKDEILLDNLIEKIRDSMDFYSPQIFPKISLKENYKILIKNMNEKYKNRKIVVDFYCDDDLYLSNPYDIFVYKCIRECLNNIYKHTESIFASIDLKIENQKIQLVIENDGGEFNSESLSGANIGRGWSYIIANIEKFDGTYKIYNSDVTRIEIEIPLRGSVYFENIIN